MKASELRIGNLVLSSSGKEIKVEELRRLSPTSKNKNIGVAYRGGADWCDINYIDLIPLTEEWLKRFGFELLGAVGKTKIYGNGILEVELNSGDDTFISLNLDGNEAVCFLRYCNEVHTLQNLHFALTGEELTINQI
jgi:hypothetical protein